MARQNRWTVNDVLSERQKIKDGLDLLSGNGNGARLRACLASVSDLQDDASKSGQLRRYIFCLSALVHHQRYGGLTGRQITDLAFLATAILRAQNISTTSKTLSFLYGDVHLVLSQIYRKSGDRLSAAWHQQLASRLSLAAPQKGDGFHAHALAVRALRLGDGAMALQNIKKAEASLANGSALVNAQLVHAKILRLVGRLQEADALDHTIRKSPLTLSQQSECDWESSLRQAIRDQDYTPLLNCVKRGRSHHNADYLIEAFFWIHATASKKWVPRLQKIRNLGKTRDLKPAKDDRFYKIAVQLEACYDTEIPFELRLDTLGAILPSLRATVSIDRELLAWAAAARWLARNHTFGLASVALNEYRALMLRLTDGRNEDTFGLVSDLLAKPWFCGVDAMATPLAQIRSTG